MPSEIIEDAWERFWVTALKEGVGHESIEDMRVGFLVGAQRMLEIVAKVMDNEGSDVASQFCRSVLGELVGPPDEGIDE
jgi:hypothetical protein